MPKIIVENALKYNGLMKNISTKISNHPQTLNFSNAPAWTKASQNGFEKLRQGNGTNFEFIKKNYFSTVGKMSSGEFTADSQNLSNMKFSTSSARFAGSDYEEEEDRPEDRHDKYYDSLVSERDDDVSEQEEDDSRDEMRTRRSEDPYPDSSDDLFSRDMNNLYSRPDDTGDEERISVNDLEEDSPSIFKNTEAEQLHRLAAEKLDTLANQKRLFDNPPQEINFAPCPFRTARPVELILKASGIQEEFGPKGEILKVRDTSLERPKQVQMWNATKNMSPVQERSYSANLGPRTVPSEPYSLPLSAQPFKTFREDSD